MIKGPFKILLYPLALLYGLVIRVRNYLYNSSILKSHSFKIPVISVGNLTVGGAGKTPHVEYIVRLLSRDYRVAVLSRGYKRKLKGLVVVENSHTAFEVGDEPAQIKSKFPAINVVVNANRVEGVNRIISEFPDTDLIVLDDAFQHRRLDPGKSILLTEYSRPFIYDYLMPFGRLREHRYNMRRADYIIITKSPLDLSPIDRRIMVGKIPPLSHQHLYFTSVLYKEPVPVFDDTLDPLCLSSISETERTILLITGIADPTHFYRYLSFYSKHITHLKFADHRAFTDKDFNRIITEYLKLPEGNRCVITTEKDAMRLKEIPDIAGKFDKNVYYIPIGIKFLNDDADEFNNFINSYVKKTKSNSLIP